MPLGESCLTHIYSFLLCVSHDAFSLARTCVRHDSFFFTWHLVFFWYTLSCCVWDMKERVHIKNQVMQKRKRPGRNSIYMRENYVLLFLAYMCLARICETLASFMTVSHMTLSHMTLSHISIWLSRTYRYDCLAQTHRLCETWLVWDSVSLSTVSHNLYMNRLCETWLDYVSHDSHIDYVRHDLCETVSLSPQSHIIYTWIDYVRHD